MKKFKINKTYLTAGFFLLFSAWVIWQAMQISEALVSNEPGPRLFPIISAIGIIICSILSIIFDGPKEKKAQEAGETKPYLDKAGWKRLVIIFAELIVYALGVQAIGFLFAGIIMMFVIIMTLKDGKKINVPTAIILSVVLPVVVYFTFSKVFVIPLPKGALWGALGITMPF